MFSVKEKQHIATKIEELVRELNHPEMDNDNIRFQIHIDGKESWSWADIKDNKTAKEDSTSMNPWNEAARGALKENERN